MGAYFNALRESMEWLSSQGDTIFLGQSVRYPGTSMYRTMDGVVPMDKRLEMPVAEEMQLGQSLGLSLTGFFPISIYPRWDFLLLATSMLVNHIDKLPLMSSYKPRMIIRTGVGSVRPLDPQWQHKGNYTFPFQLMCRSVVITQLEEPGEILSAYQRAYERGGVTILVEHSDYLNEK